MPKLSKPNRLDLIWASEALPANISTPDADGKVTGTSGTYFVTTGWEQVKPPYELENWIQNQQSQFSAYINQIGIPEWDASTEYQANKSYVQGSNNVLYKCISTHTNRNPAAGNPSYWEVFEGNRQATTSARGTVELATSDEAKAGTSDTLAVTPSGLRGVLEVLFPVGSVVMRPTNPSNSIANGGLGFGTWTRVSGRVLRGAGSTTDSDGLNLSFSVGQSGGRFRHSMSISEMPRHRHTGTTSSDTHNHTIPEANPDDARDGDGPGIDSGPAEAGSTSTSSDTHNHSFTTSYEGNGDTYDVTDPYYVVDIWRRTA